jgi:tripartite-type tricarboxylate transporter receptor subunit TctC
MTTLKSVTVTIFLALLMLASAHAQQFPKGPVKLVVPFTPGGPTDVIARLISQKLEGLWSQPVVVDYKPGAGTVVGIAHVAQSAPDGQTIGIVVSSYTINPVLRREMPYDTLKDLRGVSMLTTFAIALVANPQAPFDDIKGMVAYAKKNPGKLSFATPGVGGTTHLAVELLKSIAGIEMVHVPYKGSAPGQVDVVAGRVPLMSDPLFSAMPFVRSGRLKVLGVTTGKRVPGFEQFPSIAETYPGFDVLAYLGFVVPKKTPTEVVRAIRSASAKALQMSDLQKRIEELGNNPVGSTPEEFDRFIAADMQKWAKVIKEAHIPLE